MESDDKRRDREGLDLVSDYVFSMFPVEAPNIPRSDGETLGVHILYKKSDCRVKNEVCSFYGKGREFNIS